MIRRITSADAKRTKHRKGCAGWEGCDCFGMYVSYKDLRIMQQMRDAHIESITTAKETK